ncbi:hypothetical protein J2T09_000765 [Neorhizobium huautlense]|uniref:Uncharacterized protein n=1 Tax=Neorhizobium huautlense TaxID=67774 RepID=A0ABT9PNI5_9HYPH|nr:hypothetical protein [Neorhizobium huautlense]MDP9836023.1 hypothetical protein [Neorhizobium huautlense]
MDGLRFIWATIDPNGNVLASSEQVTVKRVDTGIYGIQFGLPYKVLPTVMGSQVLFGGDNQNPLDNVVFPMVSENGITAITGDASGSRSDRHFSFLALGV